MHESYNSQASQGLEYHYILEKQILSSVQKSTPRNFVSLFFYVFCKHKHKTYDQFFSVCRGHLFVYYFRIMF